jgi:hypothetical protein
MNLAYIGAAVGCLTLLGGGYAVAKRAEYVVDGDQVRAMILSEESVERMEFQIRYILSELRRYESVPVDERTESDIVQIQELKDQVDELRTRIKSSRGY